MKYSRLYSAFCILGLILLLMSDALRDSYKLLSYFFCLVVFLPAAILSVIDAYKYSKLSKKEKREYRDSLPIANRLGRHPYVWMVTSSAGCVFMFVQVVRTTMGS